MVNLDLSLLLSLVSFVFDAIKKRSTTFLCPPPPTLQCVAGAMYITGFSESVAEVLGLQGQWVVRGMSGVVLLALLGINLAGVKWIVRLQLLLLAVLAVSTLDFVIGTFTHLDPGGGGGGGMNIQ